MGKGKSGAGAAGGKNKLSPGGAATRTPPSGWDQTIAGGRTPVFTAEGIPYRKSDRALANDDVLVRVSVRKLDAAWRRDTGFYFGHDGGDPERSRSARRFIKTGRPMNAPEITYFPRTGRVTFTDGRHRTKAIRDSGRSTMYVTVARGSAKRVQRDLGA